MKKFILAALAALTFSAFADVSLPTTNTTALNAQILTDLVSDSKTPAEVKALLGQIINGQKGDEVVAILGIETKRTNARLEVVIRIGVDNVTDDDSGWSSVLEIRAIYNATDLRSRDGNYRLSSSSLELVAG